MRLSSYTNAVVKASPSPPPQVLSHFLDTALAPHALSTEDLVFAALWVKDKLLPLLPEIRSLASQLGVAVAGESQVNERDLDCFSNAFQKMFVLVSCKRYFLVIVILFMLQEK